MRGSSGEVEMVLYPQMLLMLVNELQKQQARIQRQDEGFAAMCARLAVLEEGRCGSKEVQ